MFNKSLLNYFDIKLRSGYQQKNQNISSFDPIMISFTSNKNLSLFSSLISGSVENKYIYK